MTCSDASTAPRPPDAALSPGTRAGRASGLLPALLCAMLALPGTALAAAPRCGRLQLPDFSGLSKKAVRSVDISIDPATLGLAGQFLNTGPRKNPEAAKSMRSLVRNLRGIYVRSYHFTAPGQYSQREVDAVRAQLRGPGWTPMVSVNDHQRDTDVQIYSCLRQGRNAGMAIVTSKPLELTIVDIVGSIDLAKLGALQGQLGVPRIPAGGSAAPPAPQARPVHPYHPPPDVRPPPPGHSSD